MALSIHRLVPENGSFQPAEELVAQVGENGVKLQVGSTRADVGVLCHLRENRDPNGPGLPLWPAAKRGETLQVMQLDLDAHGEPEAHRERYLFLDQFLP